LRKAASGSRNNSLRTGARSPCIASHPSRDACQASRLSPMSPAVSSSKTGAAPTTTVAPRTRSGCRDALGRDGTLGGRRGPPGGRGVPSTRRSRAPRLAGLGGMRRAVILFDNDCGFCRWSLSNLLAGDRHGRLRPVALQSDQADDFLMGMDRERKMESWHLPQDCPLGIDPRLGAQRGSRDEYRHFAASIRHGRTAFAKTHSPGRLACCWPQSDPDIVAISSSYLTSDRTAGQPAGAGSSGACGVISGSFELVAAGL
jgi:hypothetical protein